MNQKYSVVVFLMFLALPSLAFANLESRVFLSSDQESRYQKIIGELRCLVCQNQNLADSNADLAKDLRDKTYQMIMSGQSNQEIFNYMVSRYGDFVTYRPPLNAQTILLWAAPGLLLMVGIAVAWRVVRTHYSKR